MLSISDGLSLDSLPVIGIFIILVLREIGNFVRSDQSSFLGRMSGESRTLTELSRLDKRIKHIEDLTVELHKWHDKEDSDGVKIWYVRQSLEGAISRLTETIETQTELIKTYPAIMESIVDKLSELSREIQERSDKC